MDFTASFAIQLGTALSMGVLLFAMAYLMPEKKVLAFLVILIPWQIINSRYGSMNMVLTYLIAGALLLRGRVRLLPLLGYIFAILLVYLISMSQALKATYKDHALYIITVGSGFVLFLVIYNYLRRTEDNKLAIKLLIWTNVLVTGYSLLLLAVGSERVALFGISEFELAQNREDGRLMGTFTAAGVNAEFYTLQILILGFLSIFEQNKRLRYFYLGLACINFGLIVASGSRGSFLSTMGGIVLFLFMFRKEMGKAAISKLVGLGSIGFVAMTLIIINFTSYNVLFERLAQTEFDDSGVPDTRQQIVSATLERIPEEWLIGHGPQIRLMDEQERRIQGYKPLGGHPHNLYLFLLYTVGIVGLLAYGAFFCALFMRFWKASRIKDPPTLESRLPKLAVLLMIVFLIDQIKIEFLRFNLGDYQHYLFFLWAFLLAVSDTNRRKKRIERIRALESS